MFDLSSSAKAQFLLRIHRLYEPEVGEMNVSLTPQLELMIKTKVESGLYSDASEVVREALRLLEERDRAAGLKHELAKGIDQLRAGQGVLLTEARFGELVRRAEANAEMQRPIKDVVKP